MCEGNKANLRFLLYLLFGLLLSCALPAVLQAGEPDSWYLISETELLNIEQYKTKSETEKRNWLLQVQLLNREANILHQESAALNSQLLTARETNRRLEQSWNEYEAGQLALISLKNGEIADMKQAVADKTLETEIYKGKAVLRLVIIIALLATIAGYTAFRVSRFFRLI